MFIVFQRCISTRGAGLIDGQKVWDVFVDRQAQCMAALKMFGHPKIYQCMSELVLEINALPNGDNATQQERLTR